MAALRGPRHRPGLRVAWSLVARTVGTVSRSWPGHRELRSWGCFDVQRCIIRSFPGPGFPPRSQERCLGQLASLPRPRSPGGMSPRKARPVPVLEQTALRGKAVGHFTSLLFAEGSPSPSPVFPCFPIMILLQPRNHPFLPSLSSLLPSGGDIAMEMAFPGHKRAFAKGGVRSKCYGPGSVDNCEGSSLKKDPNKHPAGAASQGLGLQRQDQRYQGCKGVTRTPQHPQTPSRSLTSRQSDSEGGLCV